MNPYIGDFAEDAAVHWQWGSNDGDGASVTRATDGTIAVYKDNGTTESTAGVTDTEDFDSLTGVHAITIDTSADAFYATGSNYTVVLQAATIDGVTVNAPLFSFSIENRTTFPKADYPTNFASMGIEADGHVHSDVKEIEGSDATDQIRDSVVDDATRLDASALNTAAAAVGSDGTGLTEAGGDGDHLTEAGGDGDHLTEAGGTGDHLTALGTAAELAKVPKSDSNVTWNATAAAQLQTEANDAITAYDPPTRTEATSDKNEVLTRLGTPADSDVSTDIANVDANVDTLLTRVTSTLFSGITSLAEWLGLLAGKQTADATAKTEIQATGAGSGTYDEATDALEAIRDRGDANWSTSATVPTLLKSTTIATLASQTSFTLTAGSADDDAYNEAIVIVTDQSTSDQKAVGTVLNYTGSSLTVTLKEDPGVFTMAAGDSIDIIASAPRLADIQAKTDNIGNGEITVTSPVRNTDDVEIVKGDDYNNTDGRALDWTNAAGTWPDLTGATITFTAKKAGQSALTKTGSVITPSGANQKVRVELTAANTTIAVGKWSYDVQAELASGRIVTLALKVNGMEVLSQYTTA